MTIATPCTPDYREVRGRTADPYPYPRTKLRVPLNSWFAHIVSYIHILDYVLNNNTYNSISISRINQKKYLLDNSNSKKFNLFFVFVRKQILSIPSNFLEKFTRWGASTRRHLAPPLYRPQAGRNSRLLVRLSYNRTVRLSY